LETTCDVGDDIGNGDDGGDDAGDNAGEGDGGDAGREGGGGSWRRTWRWRQRRRRQQQRRQQQGLHIAGVVAFYCEDIFVWYFYDVWGFSWEEKLVAPLIAAPNGEMRK
jgi:hypothetical protein